MNENDDNLVELVLEIECSVCHGSGRSCYQRCRRCDGSGREPTQLGSNILDLVRNHIRDITLGQHF
jgi:DnaJ-class molecular chaperone